jgi:hypothetical protein
LKAKFDAIKKVKSDPGFSAFAKMTELERIAGKRKNAGATVDEQVGRSRGGRFRGIFPGSSPVSVPERFPFLKNAPMEGAYVQNVKVRTMRRNRRKLLWFTLVARQVTFKPVGIKVKNVRCLRCRAWGHQSGDRDCPLKDSNPLGTEADCETRNETLTTRRLPACCFAQTRSA